MLLLFFGVVGFLFFVMLLGINEIFRQLLAPVKEKAKNREEE